MCTNKTVLFRSVFQDRLTSFGTEGVFTEVYPSQCSLPVLVTDKTSSVYFVPISIKMFL